MASVSRITLVSALLGSFVAGSGGCSRTAPPVQHPPTLAHLSGLKPQVSVRRENELQWQDGSEGLPLYRLDAVQTQKEASAVVRFLSGSVIQMGAETLIIVREPPGAPVDRAVFRGGALRTQTRNELWLLTSAAILKLKAKSAGEPAEAKISGTEGKKIRFTLSKGAGVLIPAASGAQKAIELKPMQPVSLGPSEQRAKPKVIEKAATRQPSLKILEPGDNQEVTSSKILLKGTAFPENAKILVNGQTTPLLSGAFSCSVPLQMGANTIVVQLIAGGGNSLFKRVNVIRKE